MDGKGRTPEEKIAAIAGGAYGVVTTAELLRAGVSADQIEARALKGSLIRIHRGVYRAGHCAPSMEATYLAAVRRCGEEALLCGRAAAHLLGLIKRGPPPPPMVAVPTERRVPHIRTRRDRRGSERDGTEYRGIPITSVARTLVDLAVGSSDEELARAFHEAGVLHGTTPRQVKAVLARRPSSPDARRVRAIMLGEVRVTLSKLESAFLQVLRNAGLPLPETNRIAGGRRVDCRWPEHQLTVELDSFQFHNSRYAWERDRSREREARAREDAFRRYSWADVDHPRLMVAELRRLLQQGRPG
jgi:predicted transcriptional regulator of viral defense system